MSTGVISYSLTGNNDALAARVAKMLGAAHIRVTEQKQRTMGAIVFDLLLGRTPRVQPSPEMQDGFELIVYVAPVWMGQAASPLRAFLGRIKKKPRRYAFVSISGGADGPNPKLGSWLAKAAGKVPEIVVDLHIADLLPVEPKPTRDDTSAYRLTEDEAQKLAETAIQQLGGMAAVAS